MSKSFVDNLELGFVKQNPWILRDQRMKREAVERADFERRDAAEKVKAARGVEEPEYGPGYVTRIREQFQALATRSTTEGSPTRRRDGSGTPGEGTVGTGAGGVQPAERSARGQSAEESNAKESNTGEGGSGEPTATSEPAAPESSGSSESGAGGQSEPSKPSDSTESHGANDASLYMASSDPPEDRSTIGGNSESETLTYSELRPDSMSMAAIVMEHVEMIGRELTRKTTEMHRMGGDESSDDTSGTMGSSLVENDQVPITVQSMREKFEPGSIVKRRFSVDKAQDPPCLLISIEPCGLEEFPIAEGLFHPPPTPFPLESEITSLDFFESSIHSAGGTLEDASSALFSETASSWTIDFETTIRPSPPRPPSEQPPPPETTPVRPPDFGLKPPRRVPPPTVDERLDSADFSGLDEMRSILSKFAKKRAERHLEEELKELQPADDESSELLPSDPTPPAMPNSDQQQQQQQQRIRDRDAQQHYDASGDFLTSTDEDDETESTDQSSETLVEKVQLARADRLRPVKRRRNIEIVGGGLVPGKTNLAQGPKFERKEIEFSDRPPRAYAYLEESSASYSDEWIPGRELSLEQYKQIRDQAKIERYRKFLASKTYSPPYDNSYRPAPSSTTSNPVTIALDSQGYYTPMTIDDDTYVIKLRAPAPPSRPPPPLPPPGHLPEEPGWILEPPPPYPTYSSQSQILLQAVSMH